MHTFVCVWVEGGGGGTNIPVSSKPPGTSCTLSAKKLIVIATDFTIMGWHDRGPEPWGHWDHAHVPDLTHMGYIASHSRLHGGYFL